MATLELRDGASVADLEDVKSVLKQYKFEPGNDLLGYSNHPAPRNVVEGLRRLLTGERV